MAVMHLMATNVAVWARTVIEEIWEDFILKYIKSSMESGYDTGGGKYGKLMDPYTTEEQEQWIMDVGPGVYCNRIYPLLPKTSLYLVLLLKTKSSTLPYIFPKNKQKKNLLSIFSLSFILKTTFYILKAFA